MNQVNVLNEITLSPDQHKAVKMIEEWAGGEREGCATDGSFRFGGLAGTGKTTIIGSLPGLLHGFEPTFAAPTGKAATVLSSKLGRRAFTIHQLIYRPNEVHCDKCPRLTVKDEECHANSRSDCGCKVLWSHRGRDHDDERLPPLFVIDESSMIDEFLYNDLMDYTQDAPVLFVGDHGQLPPVGGSVNLMATPDVRLETIHRQVADSPILQLATMARTTGVIPLGTYGPGVRKVKREHLGKVIMDDDTLFLCYTNKTRRDYNMWFRNTLGFKGGPQPGERVICLKNNWRAGIHNGMTGVLTAVEDVGSRYLITVALEDGHTYHGLASGRQWGQPSTLLNDGADLWDWGYCLTVHKAQGSQAERVVVVEEHLPFISDENWRRWLYTAVTRAQKELIILAD